MVEPSHELFLEGPPQPGAVWQGWRGGRMETCGKRGGELFDFGIKRIEAVGVVAQESAALTDLYRLILPRVTQLSG